MRIVWWVLRYLFVIVALVALSLGLALQGSVTAYDAARLLMLIAMGYAVIAPLKALWGLWRRKRVVVNDAVIE